MRYVFGFMCVLALGVMGCSETAGTGGSGGSAGGGGTGGDGGSVGSGGTGGIGGQGGAGGTAGFGGDGGSGGIGGAAGAGGTGGAPECQGNEDCDDGNECTEDACADGRCNNTAAEDGAACTDGECIGGVCAPVGAFPCTEQGIRDAIAVGDGPHSFACDGVTPVVTGWEITIDKDVILDGEGRLTVDGSEDHRVFYIPVGVTAELRGIKAIRGATQDKGGGIRNGGTLTLINSTVSQSTALCEGSCLYQGFGGGIYNDNFATLTVVNSTVSNNIAREWGGGIFNSGTMTQTNSTVSGNRAKNGSGICGFDVTLTNSTVSGNTSTNGSDICAGTVTLTNSLVDGDCEGILPPTSNGYNIESPGDTCGFDQIGDRSGITAEQLNLGPLADNGEPTLTHKPGDGDFDAGSSAAIDQIPKADCEVTEDQRGEPRPVAILGPEPKCDVGSIEVQ